MSPFVPLDPTPTWGDGDLPPAKPMHVTSATRPAFNRARVGDIIEETDTGRRYVYSGPTANWVLLTDPAESTSARLRRVEQERDEALHDLDHATFQLDMEKTRVAHWRGEQQKAEAELTSAQQELALHRQHQQCAWRDLAETAVRERQMVRAQLDDAIVSWAGQVQAWAERRVDVARQDYGLTCLLCDGPIVRGQAVEPGTTEPGWKHVFCPDPNPTKES